MKINLAHISPNLNVYSETFIQNHKIHFDANVKFYYGGGMPTFLEDTGYLSPSRYERFVYYTKIILKRKSKFSLQETTLIRSFKENNINVVFAEYGPTATWVQNVCKELELPLIVNFHGFDASMYSVVEEYKERYRTVFEYASAVIAVSKSMEKKLIDIGCPSSKLNYIPCGSEKEFLEVTPTYNENSFLAIGRFIEKKAPYYTILAFRKVLHKYPNVKLYMAGEGALLEVCVNLVRYFKLENNILFLGRIGHDELINYYTKIKGFVQHSITAESGDMEGTPVAIIEASAAALPVISTRHAGIPDVIIEQKTGLLVDEHDVDGMAENMIRILDDNELAKQLGEAGRANVMANFTMEIQMNKLNNLIHKSIKKNQT